MQCARNRAVTSALEENFEQFQRRNNDEERGDNHEHGATYAVPMPEVIGAEDRTKSVTGNGRFAAFAMSGSTASRAPSCSTRSNACPER
jgi:hypothetical protein